MRYRLLPTVITLTILITTVTSYTPQPYNITCANTTHTLLQGQGVNFTNECALGCVLGECVDPTGLALTAFLILALFLIGGTVLIYLGSRVDETNNLARNFFYLFGLFTYLIGTLAVLGAYNGTRGVGNIVANSANAVGSNLYWVIIFMILLFAVLMALRYFGEATNQPKM